MDATAYRQSFSALLPPGAAWPREPDTLLQALLLGWGDELARVDGRGAAMHEEADPRTTTELLAEWERAYGLPDACTPEPGTVEARRLALLLRITSTGGASRQYFIDLAASLGITITIDEFRPWTVADDVASEMLGPAWGYTWRVNVASTTPVYEWTVFDGVDLPLRWWQIQEALECLFRRLKPAHTTLIFAYPT